MQYRLHITRGLSVLLFMLAAACGSNPAAQPSPETSIQPTAPPSTPAPLPTSSAGGDVVATVNGEEISLTHFDRALARRQLVGDAADLNALRTDVLDQLIQNVVMEQGAAAEQITISDADVDAELQVMTEAAGSAEAWNQWLATNLYTEQEFRDDLRVSLLNNRIVSNLTADLEGNVPHVHARHILVRSEADANNLMARLQAGEDFVALAANSSIDETTRERGGDLSWFTEDELLVPQLARAAFALQPGQIGGPVATELGYHIIQTLAFEDRPVELERRMSIAQVRFENWLRPLLASAVIERYI